LAAPQREALDAQAHLHAPSPFHTCLHVIEFSIGIPLSVRVALTIGLFVATHTHAADPWCAPVGAARESVVDDRGVALFDASSFDAAMLVLATASRTQPQPVAPYRELMDRVSDSLANYVLRVPDDIASVPRLCQASQQYSRIVQCAHAEPRPALVRAAGTVMESANASINAQSTDLLQSQRNALIAVLADPGQAQQAATLRNALDPKQCNVGRWGDPWLTAAVTGKPIEMGGSASGRGGCHLRGTRDPALLDDQGRPLVDLDALARIEALRKEILASPNPAETGRSTAVRTRLDDEMRQLGLPLITHIEAIPANEAGLKEMLDMQWMAEAVLACTERRFFAPRGPKAPRPLAPVYTAMNVKSDDLDAALRPKILQALSKTRTASEVERFADTIPLSVQFANDRGLMLAITGRLAALQRNEQIQSDVERERLTAERVAAERAAAETARLRLLQAKRTRLAANATPLPVDIVEAIVASNMSVWNLRSDLPGQLYRHIPYIEQRVMEWEVLVTDLSCQRNGRAHQCQFEYAERTIEPSDPNLLNLFGLAIRRARGLASPIRTTHEFVWAAAGLRSPSYDKKLEADLAQMRRDAAESEAFNAKLRAIDDYIYQGRRRSFCLSSTNPGMRNLYDCP
jgi:hypothetical protein